MMKQMDRLIKIKGYVPEVPSEPHSDLETIETEPTGIAPGAEFPYTGPDIVEEVPGNFVHGPPVEEVIDIELSDSDDLILLEAEELLNKQGNKLVEKYKQI